MGLQRRGRWSGERPAHLFPRAGAYRVILTVRDDGGLSATAEAVIAVVPSARFTRGDANGDGAFGIDDATEALLFIFTPERPALPCLKAVDFDDDGGLAIDDVLGLLLSVFGFGVTPPAPYPGCGIDATPDALPCASAGPACP